MGGEFSGVDEADDEGSRQPEEFGNFLGCHVVVVGENEDCVSGREFREELLDGAACWCWKIDLAIGGAYCERSGVRSDCEALARRFRSRAPSSNVTLSLMTTE